MNTHRRCAPIALCVCLLACLFGFATFAGTMDPDSVPAGPDLFLTLPGTFFNFGFGPVDFMGRPIGPGGADTVVQRLGEVDIPDVKGATDTISTQMTLLALQSTAPVNIGGSF